MLVKTSIQVSDITPGQVACVSRATGEAGQALRTPEDALQGIRKERTAGQPEIVNDIGRVLQESSDRRTYDAAAAPRMPPPREFSVDLSQPVLWITGIVAALAGILGYFVRCRGRSAQPSVAEAPPPPALPSTAGTEGAHDAADETEGDGLDDSAWWVPKESAVLAAPRWNADCELTDDGLRDYLGHALHDPELDLPSLPRVAQRALTMLQNEDVDYRRLAHVIGEDPAIAAKVLRLVHSTAYARMFKVNRLDLALTRLGRRALQSIILADALKGMTSSVGGADRHLAEQLWQRAIVSAALLSEMSQRCDLPEHEAFLVGLLHDVGALAILRVLHNYQRARGSAVAPALFDALCNEWHERFGQRLAHAWSLQNPLLEVISNHHCQPAEKDEYARYRLLVQFADAVSAMLGYTAYVPYDFFKLPCVAGLGIEDTASTQQWLTSLPARIIERTGVF